MARKLDPEFVKATDGHVEDQTEGTTGKPMSARGDDLTHVRDLNERDVCILSSLERGLYFLYGSRPLSEEAGRAIYVRSSPDLVMWSEAKVVFRAHPDFFGNLDFWAPECHAWNGRFYLASSFRAKGGIRGCAFLVADEPDGVFTPISDKPATPSNWHCLDGTLYVDPAGDPWMVFCHEWTQVQDGQIAAIRMTTDLGASIGEPVILFRASDAPWRFTDARMPWRFTEPQPAVGWARITDGPYLHRTEDNVLLMVWSSFCDTGYAVGQARSISGEIDGPWIQDPQPLYTMDGGHPMLFRRFDGQLMMALHSPNVGGKERPLFFEMTDACGKLAIVNEVTGNWLPKRYYPDGKDKGQGFPLLVGDTGEAAGTHVEMCSISE